MTDNGTQFKNELVEELLKLLGIQHLTILAYSHEENAIVEKKQTRRLASANPKRTHYGVGDYVLIENQSSTMGNKPPNKLLPHLKGPLKVVSRKGDRYTLLNLVTKGEEEVHLTRIHPFHYDPNYTSPRDAALRDVLSLFDVERIIDHSGDKKRRSTMDFLCKFTGWSDEYYLWLSYKELRDIDVLHSYLFQNRMKTLIPIKFKEQYRHM